MKGDEKRAETIKSRDSRHGLQPHEDRGNVVESPDLVVWEDSRGAHWAESVEEASSQTRSREEIGDDEHVEEPPRSRVRASQETKTNQHRDFSMTVDFCLWRPPRYVYIYIYARPAKER